MRPARPITRRGAASRAHTRSAARADRAGAFAARREGRARRDARRGNADLRARPGRRRDPARHSFQMDARARQHGRMVCGVPFTGELYDVLKRHSILGRLMEEDAAAPLVPDGFDLAWEKACRAQPWGCSTRSSPCGRADCSEKYDTKQSPAICRAS